MEWITALPDKVIQNCLLTWERKDGSRYVAMNAILPDENRHGLVAYMPIPHFLEDGSVWQSEYRGDDLPNKNGTYICCEDKSRKVSMLWFDARKCTFGGISTMIAFMEVPKPYSGKKKLQLVS